MFFLIGGSTFSFVFKFCDANGTSLETPDILSDRVLVYPENLFGNLRRTELSSGGGQSLMRK